MSKDDFFSGMSMPHNKELMRVFKDIELVEYLGSGIPRILKSYDRSCFVFGDNFIRIIFRYDQGYQYALMNSTQPESLEQKVLHILESGEFSKNELSQKLGQKEISGHLNQVIRELLDNKASSYTIPEKPNSRLQRYRLMGRGRN